MTRNSERIAAAVDFYPFDVSRRFGLPEILTNELELTLHVGYGVAAPCCSYLTPSTGANLHAQNTMWHFSNF